jgi:hypothetical protein
MKQICKILNSQILVLETPSRFIFDKKSINNVQNFFESISLNGIRIAWEIRRQKQQPIPTNLLSLMHEHNIIHCVDLSKETPSIESDIVYTRVFGKGLQNIYQFTDEEITEIDKKMSYGNPELSVVSYHNVKMYKDATRHTIFRKTGIFPSVTGVEGQQSIKKVLTEDTKFPITKTDLIKKQGWKVIDLTKKERVHASTILKNLHNKWFENIEEVLVDLY